MEKRAVYKNTLRLLKLIDLSSNNLVRGIPEETSLLSGLASLKLSRNHSTGKIDSDIGQMKMLECLDLSRSNLSSEIPTGLADLHYLSILDLSSNNLSGKIPLVTQLQSFDASAYAENEQLCGRPIQNCPGDDLRLPAANHEIPQNNDDQNNEWFDMIHSLFMEYFISAVLGYIVGFWGLIGPLLLKRTWRNAYFSYLSRIGDWLYVAVYRCKTMFK